MRRLILALLVLLFAIWIGVKIAADPGYVLIAYHHLVIEMPLWVAVVGVVVIFLLLYCLLRLYTAINVLPRRWRAWFTRRYDRIARELMEHNLLARAHVDMEEWDRLVALLPTLRKRKALNPEQLAALELQAHQGILKKMRQHASLPELEMTWWRLPRVVRNHPDLIVCYAHALLEKKADETAEKLVRKALEKNWHNELVRCYGLIASHKADRQLETAEAWLPQHKDDAVLLLTLGRLAARNSLWGKARNYWQASIALQPLPETYLELAKLVEQLGDAQAAKDYYRAGLELQSG